MITSPSSSRPLSAAGRLSLSLTVHHCQTSRTEQRYGYYNNNYYYHNTRRDRETVLFLSGRRFPLRARGPPQPKLNAAARRPRSTLVVQPCVARLQQRIGPRARSRRVRCLEIVIAALVVAHIVPRPFRFFFARHSATFAQVNGTRRRCAPIILLLNKSSHDSLLSPPSRGGRTVVSLCLSRVRAVRKPRWVAIFAVVVLPWSVPDTRPKCRPATVRRSRQRLFDRVG